MQLDGFGKVFKSHAFKSIATGGMYDIGKFSVKALKTGMGIMGGGAVAAGAAGGDSAPEPVNELDRQAIAIKAQNDAYMQSMKKLVPIAIGGIGLIGLVLFIKSKR